MNRRGFLAALLVAPVAVKAATLLPAGKQEGPALNVGHVTGLVVWAGPLTEHKQRVRARKAGAVHTVYTYTRDYEVRPRYGRRIVRVYRDGQPILPDGKVLTVKDGALHAKRDDLTDCLGCVPNYTFDVA